MQTLLRIYKYTSAAQVAWYGVQQRNYYTNTVHTVYQAKACCLACKRNLPGKYINSAQGALYLVQGKLQLATACSAHQQQHTSTATARAAAWHKLTARAALTSSLYIPHRITYISQAAIAAAKQQPSKAPQGKPSANSAAHLTVAAPHTLQALLQQQAALQAMFAPSSTAPKASYTNSKPLSRQSKIKQQRRKGLHTSKGKK